MPVPIAPILMALAAVLASAALTWAGRAAATVRRRRAVLARLPCAPGGAGWATGHTADMLAPDFHLRLCAWAEALGPVFTIRGVAGSKAVVIADPAALATAVGARGSGGTTTTATAAGPPTVTSLAPLPKWRPAYGVMDGVWGGSTPSIFTAADLTPRWRAVRRATAPCFSAAAVKAHFPLISARLSELGDALVARAGLTPPGQAFEVAMDGACMRLALDVIGLVRGRRRHGEKGGCVDVGRGGARTGVCALEKPGTIHTHADTTDTTKNPRPPLARTSEPSAAGPAPSSRRCRSPWPKPRPR